MEVPAIARRGDLVHPGPVPGGLTALPMGRLGRGFLPDIGILFRISRSYSAVVPAIMP
jgi:hypothetical protein